MKTILALVLTACVSFAQTDGNYGAVFESSKAIATLAFPDVAKSDSAIIRKMHELNEKAEKSGSPLFNNPNKPLILSIMAAKELGLPVNVWKLSDAKLAVYRSIHGRMDEFREQLNTEKPEEKPAPVAVVEAAAPAASQQAAPAPISDGLVTNPVLWMRDMKPSDLLAEYISEPMVTPERSREIVAEKRAVKEAAKKEAQMDAILSDMDDMENQLRLQQRRIREQEFQMQQFRNR